MSPTDYDTWLTEGDVHECPYCGRRARSHYPGRCARCEALAEDAEDEDAPKREDRVTVLALNLRPGLARIVTEARHGLRLTCRETGAGYEATAEWGSCAGPECPDSRGSLTVLRLELWRALEDLEAALVYLADSVEAMRCDDE